MNKVRDIFLASPMIMRAYQQTIRVLLLMTSINFVSSYAICQIDHDDVTVTIQEKSIPTPDGNDGELTLSVSPFPDGSSIAILSTSNKRVFTKNTFTLTNLTSARVELAIYYSSSNIVIREIEWTEK